MRRIRYGMNTENKVYDYLVIGSGLAGLSAAIELSQYGHVLVATKVAAIESNSFYAQGGIACVMDPDDSPHDHITDTLNPDAASRKKISPKKSYPADKTASDLLKN